MIKNYWFLSLVLLFAHFVFTKPLYDIAKTFEQNCEQDYYEYIPKRILPPKSKWTSLLGYPIVSALGVPACSIMTGKGITFASKLGFDVLTYKTIRSHKINAYEHPNICYVDCDHQITKQEINSYFCVSNEPIAPEAIAISNSFGNGSFDQDWIKRDIARARASLSEGQVLIVSVFGQANDNDTLEQDFAQTALIAQDAGAQIIEANLSCPNIAGEFLYKNCAQVQSIIKKMCSMILIPVIIKVGIFDSEEQMRLILKTAAHAGARGICGINSIPIQVITKDNQPFFGLDRKISGLSGMPIHALALEFITNACTIIQEEKLDLIILATGGATKPEHFQDFFDAGATIAMSATGMMWNPYLALEYHYLKQKTQE